MLYNYQLLNYIFYQAIYADTAAGITLGAAIHNARVANPKL